MAKVRDVTLNKDDAQELVDRLVSYYHKQGKDWVRVWIEPELMSSGRRLYCIRSNLQFRVPFMV